MYAFIMSFVEIYFKELIWDKQVKWPKRGDSSNKYYLIYSLAYCILTRNNVECYLITNNYSPFTIKISSLCNIICNITPILEKKKEQEKR